MRWLPILTSVLCLGLLAAVGLLFAAEPPVPPPGTAAETRDAVLGKLLFTDVVSVHFIGPALPANSDGSLGGLAAGDDGTQMKIYERFIVREATDPAGTTFRTLYAYETLGRVEQRLVRPKVEVR
jgi:hypothetical protein